MNLHTFPYVLKIATVEDAPVVADRLKSMLAEMSYIEFAGNATNISDAMHLINDKRPGVVILDIHLKENAPAKSGIDLLANIRSVYPHMKIIMLTNLSSQQYRTRCHALGADYFFDKTNDFEKLPETLMSFVPSNPN